MDIPIEKLVEEYQKAQGVIEETEAARQVIKDELLDRLKKLKVVGVKTKNGYFVKRVTMTSFSGVNISVARELGAVETKEAVDLGKLRQLQQKGVKIAGSKSITYVKVEEAK